MTSPKKVLCAASVITLCGAPAIAEIKYFQVPDGSWHLNSNWDPPQRPDADDTAVISQGQTCWIRDDDGAVQKVDLSGTLRIEGRTLAFSPLGQVTYVYGLLHTTGSATIQLNGDLTIKGSGFIRSDGTALRITQSASGMTFTLTGVNDGPTTPTLRGGNVTLSVSRVVNNGHILAATADAVY
jgi:hypothetical protein